MNNLDIIKPEEELIETYKCDGCDETVNKKNMRIPLGPQKGEWIIVEQGCRCEDIALSKIALDTRHKLKAHKHKRFFDDNSLINRSLANATLDNYTPTNEQLATAKREMTNYVDDFDGTTNLLIHGTYGTGKSHLSVAVTKKLIEKGYTCLFMSLPKLLTKLRDTYNNDSITEDRLLRHLQSVDLLVLDDLGAEQKTDWSIPKLFEIMDDRAGKSTIYTTNLNSKDLKKHMNERNFSRLMENTKIIIMNGDDYRRKSF